MNKLIIASILAFSATALADSPHWSRTSAALDTAGDLNVKFKLAGLGANEAVAIEASANGSATYGCMAHSGQFPDAANKVTATGVVFAAGTFTSGKNGTVSGTLTLTPPDAGAFTCPHGQKLTLTAVDYANVALYSDVAGLAPIAGDFGAVFYTP